MCLMSVGFDIVQLNYLHLASLLTSEAAKQKPTEAWLTCTVCTCTHTACILKQFISMPGVYTCIHCTCVSLCDMYVCVWLTQYRTVFSPVSAQISTLQLQHVGCNQWRYLHWWLLKVETPNIWFVYLECICNPTSLHHYAAWKCAQSRVGFAE